MENNYFSTKYVSKLHKNNYPFNLHTQCNFYFNL